jgi:hypothetical protein
MATKLERDDDRLRKAGDDEDDDKEEKEDTDEEKDDEVPPFLKNKKKKLKHEVDGDAEKGVNTDDDAVALFDADEFLNIVKGYIDTSVSKAVRAATGRNSVILKSLEYIVEQNEEIAEVGAALSKSIATIDKSYALIKSLKGEVDDADKKVPAGRENRGAVKTDAADVLQKSVTGDVATGSLTRGGEIPKLLEKASSLESSTGKSPDGYDKRFVSALNTGTITDDMVDRLAKGIAAAESGL